MSLKMPPRSGTYDVTRNEIKIRDFPAGETVSPGNMPVSVVARILKRSPMESLAIEIKPATFSGRRLCRFNTTSNLLGYLPA